jgi:hypothetical protein
VIDDVTVRFVSREGEIEILGAALVDGAGGTHQLAAQATVLPLASDPSHYRPVYEDRNSYVAENTQPAPRAFMVYAAAPAPGGRASLGVLTDAAFQPRRQVLLDEPVPTDLPSAAPRDATADIATYEDRRVLVGVHTPSSGLLVLADANYPGWRAYVDGSETPILTADSIFRAVRVPAGDHLVEFTYEPFTFRLGAAISLGTLALLACVGVNVWRQSRRAHRHQANAALRRHLTEPKGFA